MLDPLAVKLRLLDASDRLKREADAMPSGPERLYALGVARGMIDAVHEIDQMQLVDMIQHAQPDPAIPGIGPAERMAIADYARQKGE